MRKKLKAVVQEAESINLDAEIVAAPAEEKGHKGHKGPKGPKGQKGQKPPPKPKKASALGAARALLGKAFKEEGSDEVLVDESRWLRSFPHIKSGCMMLDHLIGGIPNHLGVEPCPGLPRGRIINLYGMESSGKTTLCLQAAAEVCKAGGSVCYIDYEQAVDIAYAKNLGVPVADTEQFLLVQPATFEKGLAILWTMVRAGVDLVVIDSVASGATMAQWEKKIEESHEVGRLGAKSAQWSEFLPKLKAMMNRTNTCVIGISQLRAKINTGPGAGHGEQTSPQGGNAWRFYSELRIMLKKFGTEKTTKYDPLTNSNVEMPYGNIVNIKIDKCKVSASQGREGKIYIRFGEGIDNIRSILEVATARGIVKKGGAWLQWERADGSSVKMQGSHQFREALKKDPVMFEELKTLTLASLNAAQKRGKAEEEEEEEDTVGDEIDSILEGAAPGVRKPDEAPAEE
jgi:recombination protein RecA